MKDLTPAPKLVPLCKPLFDFVCEARLHIDSGTGAYASMTAEDLAVRVDTEIDQIRQRKNSAPELAALVRDQDPLLDDLRAFATWLLASGITDTSRAINVIRARRDAVQDEAFTDHLRAELKGVNPSTAERLVIYAICLGLGYQGAEEERTIRKLRSEVWGHIQRIVPMPRREHARSPAVKPLFAEAYDIRTETLHTAPVRWWLVYLASAVALAAIVVAVFTVLGVGKEVDGAIDRINAKTQDAAAASGPIGGEATPTQASAPQPSPASSTSPPSDVPAPAGK